MNQQTYVTVRDFAAHRKVHKSTVHEWIKRGLPSIRQGGGRRILVVDADRWLDAGGANGEYEIGVIGIDSGRCIIGDPGNLLSHDGVPNADAPTCEQIPDLDDVGVHQLKYKLGHEGLGVVVETGYGDGLYPVFVRQNKEGRIAEVVIRFINTNGVAA